MLIRRFSLLEAIGNVLRVGLAVEKGNFPERWVELIDDQSGAREPSPGTRSMLLLSQSAGSSRRRTKAQA